MNEFRVWICVAWVAVQVLAIGCSVLCYVTDADEGKRKHWRKEIITGLALLCLGYYCLMLNLQTLAER